MVHRYDREVRVLGLAALKDILKCCLLVLTLLLLTVPVLYLMEGCGETGQGGDGHVEAVPHCSITLLPVSELFPYLVCNSCVILCVQWDNPVGQEMVL